MMTTTLDDQQAFHDRIGFLRDVLQRWLARSDTVLACGRWSEGAVGEFNPVGRGQVLSARYKDCFAWVGADECFQKVAGGGLGVLHRLNQALQSP